MPDPSKSMLDIHARTPGELLRAARRQQRLQAAATAPSKAALPWLLPVLFVPGVGATRLRLLESRSGSQQDSHGHELWDPDDDAAQARLYRWIDEPVDPTAAAGWARELADRWRAPAQVLREHDEAARLRLMSSTLGLEVPGALVPALQRQLLARYAGLEARGWSALAQVYWPLAAELAPHTDPVLAFSAHAHGWDWRQAPASAAPGLAARVLGLIEQTTAHVAVTPWRWPAQRCVVIVAENSGVDLVRAALPLLPQRSVLAVYTVDDVQRTPAHGSPAWFAALCNDADSGGRMPRIADAALSHGWHQWQRALHGRRGARLAVNAVLPGPLGLLPSAAGRHWLQPDTPASALNEPWQMLLATARWDAPSAPLQVVPQPLDGIAPHPSDPPTDAAWRGWALAAMQTAMEAARARSAAVSAHPSVPFIECNRCAPVRLGLHWQCEPGLPEETPGWRFVAAAETAPPQPSASHGAPELRASTATGLCSAIMQDLTRRLLRSRATPHGQAWTALGERTLNGTGASNEPTPEPLGARAPSTTLPHRTPRHDPCRPL